MPFPGIDWTFRADEPCTLAEACGHAWVQMQAGGSVTIIDPCIAHPWWAVLRQWLPEAAPLRISSRAASLDLLPARPYPPVHLSSLPRQGQETVDLALLAMHEPWLLVPPASTPAHPAIAVALAAIAGWGWRVCWPTIPADDWLPACQYIGTRQLPLHIITERTRVQMPETWLTVPVGELGLWLQHDWPTIYTSQST